MNIPKIMFRHRSGSRLPFPSPSKIITRDPPINPPPVINRDKLYTVSSNVVLVFILYYFVIPT